MRRPTLACLALLLAAVALVEASTASSPCPSTPEYDVDYQAPRWIVSIRWGGDRFPGGLDRLAVVTPWNDTPVLLGDHVDRPATEEEPVTLLDRDGDRNLSAGDQLQF